MDHHAASSHYGAHGHPQYHNPMRAVQAYGDLPPPHYTLGSNMHDAGTKNVHGFSFDMWVSAPQQANRVDKALHAYTRLQGDLHHPIAPPMPLENVNGWRSSFPHLSSLIDELNGPLECDIIMLEVNLQLMTDFPPSGSRLGIQLDLDFGHPTAGDVLMVSQMENWTCSTRLYEDGRELRETYHDLLKPQSTKVKPLFESSWWARVFTELTQDKRIAEDSGQPESVHATDERTRRFFRSLSAVQEIRAVPASSRRLSNQFQGHGDESERMAILVWKFRQTRPGEVGTTTWRRLIPPPDRTSTNSPHPNSGWISPHCPWIPSSSTSHLKVSTKHRNRKISSPTRANLNHNGRCTLIPTTAWLICLTPPAISISWPQSPSRRTAWVIKLL